MITKERATKLVALFFYLYIKQNLCIMKIKCKTEITREGVEYQKGDIVEIPEANVSKWIAKGWGEAIDTKEEKAKKETKEFKAKKQSK